MDCIRRAYADFKIWKSAGSLQSQPQTDFTAMMIWLGGADGGPPPFLLPVANVLELGIILCSPSRLI
jgi:hypothetical protein